MHLYSLIKLSLSIHQPVIRRTRLSTVGNRAFLAVGSVCRATSPYNNNNNGTYIAHGIFASAANALMRISVKQKCFQFVLECVQRDVCRPQIDVWQTVPRTEKLR